MQNSLQLRVRRDLHVFARGTEMAPQYVVKDPVGFSHFVFSAEELFLLKLFNGKHSMEEIRRLWQEEFRTNSLSEKQLLDLTQRFIRDNLLVVEHSGIGKRLYENQKQTKQNQLFMKFASPLVIKLGSVNPVYVLDLLWLPGKIFFSRPVVFLNLFIAFLVLASFVGNFERISTQAANMGSFFEPRNLVIVTILIVAIKILHELAHATACTKFGGECFEIGILLLAFFPTLYCDVSDSWTFKSKWKRILVSFAGIYVEIMMATGAAVLWLMTEPGLANTIYFNVAVMCSINTVFINGNPLLRYDGYYMLSDFVEQPNLSQNSKAQLNDAFCSLFFDQVRTQPKNYWLICFGFCQLIYRWFVILSISLGVYLILKTYEFGFLSEIAVGFILFLMALRMLKTSTIKRAPTRRVNWLRTICVTCFLSLFLAALFLIPVPAYVYCNLMVESKESTIVYATASGKLDISVDAFDYVEAGQLLCAIEAPDLIHERKQLEKKLLSLQDRSDRLERQQESGLQLASEIVLLKNEIETIRIQLDLLEEKEQELEIRSAAVGNIRPIAIRKEERVQDPGTLLDEANKDAYVSRGQELFTIEGDDKVLVGYLGEEEIEFLDVDQQVEVVLFQKPKQRFDAEIREIVEIEATLDETQLALSGLETMVDQTGNVRTIQTPYRVIFSLHESVPNLMTGSNGRARIGIPSKNAARENLVRHQPLVARTELLAWLDRSVHEEFSTDKSGSSKQHSFD